MTCYAVRGFREKGPAAVAVGRIAPTGRTAPKAPVGQPCSDDELFPWLTTPIQHWQWSMAISRVKDYFPYGLMTWHEMFHKVELTKDL